MPNLMRHALLTACTMILSVSCDSESREESAQEYVAEAELVVAAGSAEEVEGAVITAPTPNLPDDVETRFLDDVVARGSVKLFNGQTGDPKNWLSLVLSSHEGLSCTSTLIGPDTVLTAAHCVDAKDPIDKAKTRLILLRDGTKSVRGDCKMHHTYASADIEKDIPRSHEDYALCKLSSEIKGRKFDSITTDALLENEDKIVLTGFGCTKIEIKNNKFDFSDWEKELNIGAGTVKKTPSMDNVYIKTTTDLKNPDEPALCPGDSGGPAVVYEDLDDMQSARKVVGVNSSISAYKKTEPGNYELISSVSALSTPTFETFLKSWIKHEHKTAKICGYNLFDQNMCR